MIMRSLSQALRKVTSSLISMKVVSRPGNAHWISLSSPWPRIPLTKMPQGICTLSRLVNCRDYILPHHRSTHIQLQLGAGTAVPTLTLFARLLQAEAGQSERHITLTFADYNSDVLRLVTLPNLLLTWHNSRSQTAVSADSTASAQEEEELDITPELIEEFKGDLAKRKISIEFVSGAWSADFVELVFSSGEGSSRKTLVLASETIYSPASLTAFSETLSALLRRSSNGSTQSRALIAAKKVYFGVGGGVDEFLAVLNSVCPNELNVQQKLNVQSEGVGRVVLEVIPAAQS